MKLKEQIRPEGGAQPWIKTTETETLLIDIDLISFHFGPCTDPSHQNMTRLSILVQSRGRGTTFFGKMLHDGNHVSCLKTSPSSIFQIFIISPETRLAFVAHGKFMCEMILSRQLVLPTKIQ